MSLDEVSAGSAEPPTGATLREVIAGKPVEQRRAVVIVRQVLEALAAMHAGGKVHGDVRPETIGVASALGKDVVRLGAAGAAKGGDPMYRAPQAAIGAAEPRVDLYAVGVVLYELLTGRPPFVADDPDAVRRLHAYAPLQPLKQRAPGIAFADELETIVATALSKKRDSRYRSAQDMIEALDRVLATTEQAAPPPSPPADAEPGEASNDSLRLLAQDLMPVAARTADPSAPVIPENVSRDVPALPWHSRAQLAVRRTLDRVAAKVGLPRRVVGGIAVALAIGLVLVVVTCRGGSTTTTKPRAAAKPKPALTVNDLHGRCERLGKACGQGAKRISKIIAECTQAATTQVERGCASAAITAYDCYEQTLCGKADPVWTLDDLRVLSGRKRACEAEGNALRACVDDARK